jgi:hypothetical protein
MLHHVHPLATVEEFAQRRARHAPLFGKKRGDYVVSSFGTFGSGVHFQPIARRKDHDFWKIGVQADKRRVQRVICQREAFAQFDRSRFVIQPNQHKIHSATVPFYIS